MRLGAIDASTGALDTGFAAPTGYVSAPSPGGTPLSYSDGELYARTTGGDLEVSRFDGATGAFDPRWRPAVQGFYGEGADVTALAVGEGAAFVGGVFEIAGVERAIGAIDLTTGKLDPGFNAGAARGTELAAAAGWLYYLDEAAGRLRRVDGRTGAPDGSYSLQVVGGVSGLTAFGDRIYVAGNLSFIGGEPADGVAALDAATGAVVPAFKPTISGGVSAVIARGDAVWLAGAFTKVGGLDRPGLAQVSAATGAVRAAFSAPSAGSGVGSLVTGRQPALRRRGLHRDRREPARGRRGVRRDDRFARPASRRSCAPATGCSSTAGGWSSPAPRSRATPRSTGSPRSTSSPAPSTPRSSPTCRSSPSRPCSRATEPSS